MFLRTQHEFLFVGRDEDSFVENYCYDLGEGSEINGKIFINLEIQNNPAEAELIGETIFDTLRKSFFSDLEKDPYIRFEDSLKEINKILNTISQEKVSKHIGNLHVIIAAIVDNNLYLTQCGEAEAYLVRRRFCSVISEGLSDAQSQDYFNNIASGILENGDVVLLSSTRLLRYITKTDLAKITASNRNLVATLAELKDFLSSEILARIGFIGISVEESEASGKEKDQSFGHIQKEEEYAHDGVEEHKKSMITFQSVKQQASTLFLKAKDRFGDFRNNTRNRGGRTMTGSSAQEMNFSSFSKEKILIILVTLIIVFIGGIFWLKGRAAEQAKVDQLNATLNEVRETINSAESTYLHDPIKAIKMLNEASDKAKVVLNSRYNRQKANELLKNIEKLRDKLDGIQRAEPQLLANLAEKRPGVDALGLLSLKDNLYAFEYNALYPILLNSVLDPLTIDDKEKVIAGTFFEDNNSLLFFTDNKKLIEYKDNNFTSVQSEEGSFHEGTAVQGYDNKFYILDTVQNQIWRYVRRRDKFSSAEKYNSEGNVKNAVSLSIDGSIYLLTNDGSILKFLLGKQKDLQIKKSPSIPLAQPTKILTALDMQRVYVLESNKNRLLIYEKDKQGDGLSYVSQYVFENLDDVRDFQISKDEKILYLLDKTKVYKLNLS
jgi:hypothetical protein